MHYASIRFIKRDGTYFPAVLALPTTDFRTAGEILFAYVAGFEALGVFQIAAEGISVNKPRGSVPIVMTNKLTPEIYKFLGGTDAR